MKPSILTGAAAALSVAFLITLWASTSEKHARRSPGEWQTSDKAVESRLSSPPERGVRSGAPILCPSLAAGTEPKAGTGRAESPRVRSRAVLNAKVKELEEEMRQEKDPTKKAKLQAFMKAIEQIRETVN